MYPSADHLLIGAISDGDCLIWDRAISTTGYGTLTFGGRKWYAHRMVFTIVHGPIPEGMDVCHSCDRRPCVNPEHLWVGTRADNMRDASQKGRISWQKKTHCPKGHAYDEVNTRIYRGSRYCRTCMLAETHKRRGGCPSNPGGPCIHLDGRLEKRREQ